MMVLMDVDPLDSNGEGEGEIEVDEPDGYEADENGVNGEKREVDEEHGEASGFED